MIGGQRAVFCGEFCATEIAELIGVQMQRQSQLPCPCKYSCNLARCERDRFAIRVDGIGKSALRDRRQQLLADQFDIAIDVIAKLGRNGMCREQRRLYCQPGCFHRDVAQPRAF